MRARAPRLRLAALSVGGCLYSEYGVVDDGGARARADRARAVSAVGAGPRAAPLARDAAAPHGSGGHGARDHGRRGVERCRGQTGASGGTGGNPLAGTGGVAGSGGTTGAGGTAATGGRGGTTGVAGTGGAVAGRGGTTGVAGTGGGTAGRGGTTGTAGSVGGSGGAAGRGGTAGVAGTGGGTAGRGGTTGSGGSTGAGGSTAAPNWVPSFSVVYQLDLGIGQLGVEAHGGVHLEEQGTFFPISDPVAIEGNAALFRLQAQDPGRLVQPGGTALPTVLQTPPGTSFTLGGWFRFNSAQPGDIQYLISDDGPGAYQGGFIFYLDQNAGRFDTSGAAAYCRIGFSGSTTDFNYNEAETPTEVGTDSIAGNRWAHLVCRYDANNGTLSVFIGGSLAVQEAATKPIRSGPGPFMLGCDQTYCGFAGNMDEVFFTRSALDDAHVNRIYACGIDGNRCRCSGSGYVSCGYAAPSGCLNLPTCDVAQ